MTGPLKVLISADMEGISGVTHPSQLNAGGHDYEAGRELMAGDVNAVITGLLQASGSASVLVADAHGSFRNLLPERLDPRAGLISGSPRPLGMIAGLENGTDLVLLVGYHGKAGSGPAVLAHTMSPAILDVRLNGRSVGEIGLNAAVAGHVGAAVAFLSGDETACRELETLVPGVVTVAVKRALGQAAAELLHPATARARLTEGAARAIEQRGQLEPWRIPGPVDLDVDLYRPHVVDVAALIPGARRGDGARTVSFTCPDVLAAYRIVQLLVQLGQNDVP